MTAPSNNAWRISGLLGEDVPTDPTTQETMLQGLGYPLRPVDNVPLTITPELPDGLVAQGFAMQFMPNGYEEGKYYARGSVVTDGTWTMISDKTTLENPFPTPSEPPSNLNPSFTPVTQSDSSVVYSGFRLTFLQSGTFLSAAAWVTQLTTDTNYRVVSIVSIPDQPVVTSVIENPVLVENAWANIGYYNQIIPAGTEVVIYIDGLNSGASNQVSGGWTYTGQNNTGAPVAQAWNHNNANTIVRIDKTDLDGTDRTSELEGITPDSILLFADTDNPSAFFQYRVTGALTDSGTYFSYPTILQEVGENGLPQGTSTLTATIPIPQPTEYAEQTGVLPNPTWATVQGYLAFDGVEQPAGQANTYGIDIEFQPLEVSDDWQIVAYNAL